MVLLGGYHFETKEDVQHRRRLLLVSYIIWISCVVVLLFLPPFIYIFSLSLFHFWEDSSSIAFLLLYVLDSFLLGRCVCRLLFHSRSFKRHMLLNAMSRRRGRRCLAK